MIMASSRPTTGSLACMNVIRPPSVRIHHAVRDNNVALLHRLKSKYDLRNTDSSRLTSLAWAALAGSLEAFEFLLLDCGHDDYELSRDEDNNTIFHILATVPSEKVSLPGPGKDAEQMQAMAIRMGTLYYELSDGRKVPFLIDWSNAGGKTAMHVAAQAGHTGFVELLCDLGADVDLSDTQGNTPLHYAAAWNHLSIVHLLLHRGCQYSVRNFEGFTASDFAYSTVLQQSLLSIARDAIEERRLIARRREVLSDEERERDVYDDDHDML